MADGNREHHNRRERCRDCPLVGDFCNEHHEMIASQGAKMDLLRNRMTMFFTVIGLVVAVSGGLMAIILSFLRQDTSAIRADISMHLSQHIEGSFVPSRDAQPRHSRGE